MLHDIIKCKFTDFLVVFSNYKQEIVAKVNNSQPQCTTTALIVCKSIHFDDDTLI